MTKKLHPFCLGWKKYGLINDRPLTFEELCKLAESEIKEWKKFQKDIKTMRLKNKKCKKT